MSEFEKAVLAGVKAFVAALEGAQVSKPQMQAVNGGKKASALSFQNGIPICTIHGKSLRLSKAPKYPGSDYYCPTKDDATGKWCPTKCGKEQVNGSGSPTSRSVTPSEPGDDPGSFGGYSDEPPW